MKLSRDATGTELGGRHELCERNNAGNHEDIRIQKPTGALRIGAVPQMTALVGRCMAGYDENGWVGGSPVNPGRLSVSPRGRA